jgi:subtilisin family serine protease
MSFGFPRRTEPLECIHRAIQSAYAANVVILAAARNNGGNQSIAYPANQDEVICISSTDGQGNRSSFNPSPVPGRNLATVGEAVLSSWIGGGRKRKSGTSFAAPIAAGVAAIAMDYVRQKTPKSDQYVASRVRNRKGMLAVLKHLSSDRDGFEYIAPWKLFCPERAAEITGILLDTLRRV